MTLSKLTQTIITEDISYFWIPVANQHYWVDLSLTGLFRFTVYNATVQITNPSSPGSFSSYGSGTYIIGLYTSSNIICYGPAGASFMFERIKYDTTLSRTGTVDTITSTGTYTGTGSALVLLVGGGQGGAIGGKPPSQFAGSGGGAGGNGGSMAYYYFDQLPGSAPVVIGSGGIAPGGAGGDSFFNSLPSNSGPTSITETGRGGGQWGSPTGNGETLFERRNNFNGSLPGSMISFIDTIQQNFAIPGISAGGGGGTFPGPGASATGGAGGGVMSGGGRGGPSASTPPPGSQSSPGGGGGGGGGGVPGSPGATGVIPWNNPGAAGGAGGAGRVWVYRRN